MVLICGLVGGLGVVLDCELEVGLGVEGGC